MSTPNLQLTGGRYQDEFGTPLSFGYILLELSHDAKESTDPGTVSAGIKKTITLDVNGSIPNSPVTLVWANDALLPAGTFYIVRWFKQDGTEADKYEQYWQLTSSPNPLDVGTIIPVNPQAGLIGGGGGSGTVTSVGLSMPSEFTVSGSPVTTSGTLTVTKANETANTVFAGPGSGGAAQPTFRALVAADLPNIGNIQGISVSTTTPQTGDTLRYNEYGDSKWDITSGYPAFYYACSQFSGTGYSIFPSTTTPASFGTQSNLAATATEPFMQRSTGAAGASTDIRTGVNWPQGGAAYISFGSMRRFTIRTRLGNTTNARYWVGLSEYQGTIGTSSWATDTPNMNYAAFRYSNGTDTTIKAVAGTATANQTVVNTGVSPDTANSVLFEITFDGTNINYYINGALVGQISTNVMPTSTLILGNAVGDNKNTATVITQDVAHIRFTVK